jgi:hypothetical protein
VGLNNGTVAVTTRNAMGFWSTGVTLAGGTSGFGVALALDGGWALIAEDQSARTVRPYEYLQGVFHPRPVITQTEVQVNAAFGARMDISENGRVAVITAFDYDDLSLPGDDHGIAFVYERIGTEWVHVQALTAGEDAVSDGRFGLSAAISGDGRTVAIGGGQRVHVFRRSQTTGTYTQEKVLISGLSTPTLFGWDVDLSDDGQTLLVGLPAAYGNVGSAWLYRRNGGLWESVNSVGSPTAGQHGLGWAVAVSDGIAAAGTLSHQGAPGGPTTAFFAWGNDLDAVPVWNVPNNSPTTTYFGPTAARLDVAMDGPWIFVGVQSTNALPEIAIFSIFTPPPTTEELAIDFGTPYGIYTLRLAAGWIPRHPFTAEQMIRADVDGTGQHDLVVDFGAPNGVWVWRNRTTWQQLNSLSPTEMAVGDLDDNGRDDIVFSFPSAGIWAFKNGFQWIQLHPSEGTDLALGNLDDETGDELIVNLLPNLGVWTYLNSTAWVQLHPLNASHIATNDLDGNGRDDVIFDFPSYGLYSFKRLGPFNDVWTPLHPFSATHFAMGDLDGNGLTDLVIDFGSPYGIWTFRNGNTWIPLHATSAESIVVLERHGGGRDDIVVDFGPQYGLWEYADSSLVGVFEWKQIHAFSPRSMTVGIYH